MADIVSILTRPYGRMLFLSQCTTWTDGSAFQSSPALTGGCYEDHQAIFLMPALFQSSPALTGGCYNAASTAAAPASKSFNPHPPLRADAIVLRCKSRANHSRFNPHPPLRADAIRPPRGVPQQDGVSILTRPYGRMLLALTPAAMSAISRFQSSPALTGGCYVNFGMQAGTAKCFNPHPPLRADAMFLTQALDLPRVFSPFPRSPLWQVWNLPAGDQG